MNHKVDVRLEKRNIPTYEQGKPEINPVFFEKRIYHGSSGKVYPVPFINKIYDHKTDKIYDATTLCRNLGIAYWNKRTDGFLTAHAKKNPDIIFILADDLGYDVVSCLNPGRPFREGKFPKEILLSLIVISKK